MLRPVSERDLTETTTLALKELRWRGSRVAQDPTQISGLLRRSLWHATFAREDALRGYVAIYNAEFPARIGWLDVLPSGVLDQSDDAAALIPKVASKAQSLRLRKLYFETIEGNRAETLSALGALTIEAELPRHVVDGSQCHSVYILSIDIADVGYLQ